MSNGLLQTAGYYVSTLQLYFRRNELPLSMELPLGTNAFHGLTKQYGLSPEARRQHVLLCGGTGSGKSSLLLNWMHTDILANRGFCLIDPHGDLAEQVIRLVPRRRTRDFILLDPSDFEWPIGLNVFDQVPRDRRFVVAEHIVNMFKAMHHYAWGDRLHHILHGAVLGMLDVPNATIIGVQKMILDEGYRRYIIQHIDDPVIRMQWELEFEGLKKNGRQAEFAQSTLNKIGEMVSTFPVRNLVGQPRPKLKFREVMESQKILICNFAKGRIGETNAQMLGMLTMIKLMQAAFERIDTPEEQRVDFPVYIDEFQNFALPAMAFYLAESRKYRLNWVLAHQYLAQIEDKSLRESIFANVKTQIVFRVSSLDAKLLLDEFAPEVRMADLVNLPNWEAYVRLFQHGLTHRPFHIQTPPPPLKRSSDESQRRRERMIHWSRNAYGTRREIVETHIRRFLEG